MKKYSLFKELMILLIGSIILLVFGAIFFIFILELSLPNVSDLKNIHLQVPMRIYSRDAKLIAEFGEIKRIPVSLNQIPKSLVGATLATEDQRYFSHSGVDPWGLARATLILVSTGQKWEGGSTITMQVARSFFLSRKKTYGRKLKEILLALKIDHEFSKEKILELYFNQNFYGNRAYGIAAAAQVYFGKTLDQLTLPEAALLAGLPKAPTKLNPLINPSAAKIRRNHVLKRMLDLHYINRQDYAQAINAPVTADYHGFTIAVHAPHVAEMVRQLMVDQYGDDIYDKGLNIYTTVESQAQEAADEALQKQLQIYDHRHGYIGPEQNVGHIDSHNAQDLFAAFSDIHTINGLHPAIITQVNAQLATAVLKSGQFITIPWEGMTWARKRVVRDNQEYLGARPKNVLDVVHMGDIVRVVKDPVKDTWVLTQIPDVEASLVAMDTHNGAVLALCGGFNFYKSKFNRAIQAERQPGSAFKPFIYSAALAKGFTLATLINDAPVAIPNIGNNNELWRPENDTKRFYGPTRLREALIRSRNLVSIRLLDLIGIPYAVDYLARFGFKPNQLPQTLSLALGSGTVTPIQLTASYAAFANGGFRMTPYFIDRVIDHDNHTIYQSSPSIAYADGTNKPVGPLAPRILSPQNAFLITSALQDVIRLGTGVKALYLHRNDLAGKTGTTNNQMDAWFCGYNSNLVATVWVGYDQSRSMYEHAFTAAVPMWASFMEKALQNKPNAPVLQPSNIFTARIDKTSGLMAPSGRNTVLEYFERGTEPKKLETSPDVNFTAQKADDGNTDPNPTESPSTEEDLDPLY